MATTCLPFRYALTTNSAATDFAAKNATSTEPSGAGIFNIGDEPYGGGCHVPSWIQIVPFGTNADNETFDMRIYGYSEAVATDLVTDTKLYIPQLLIDLTVTLSAITFSDHAASTFLADTIVINDGPVQLDATVYTNSPFLSVVSPAEDLTASAFINTRGCKYIRFEFDIGTADNANCLWRPADLVT